MEKNINYEKEVKRLKTIIDENLISLIDNDYVLWDLPYHKNIGDTLIWQGELDFLSQLDYHLLDYGSRDTASLRKYDESVIILLHGGGNFGDIYRSSQNFRNKVIQKYPNNKIIILPQSIHYKNNDFIKSDKEIINIHTNLYLCVRDLVSYEFALEHFNLIKVLLVPDMAFYINSEVYSLYQGRGRKKLFLKRKDIEFQDSNYRNIIPDFDSFVISDWPTFERKYLSMMFVRFFEIIIKLNISRGINNLTSRILNFYMSNLVKKKLLKCCFMFLSDFNVVYTTRLHVFIASILLNKEIFLLDNNYRKINNFYDLWLSKSRGITPNVEVRMKKEKE